MNEVTRIHLGRQPYTISVAAHQELKDYLADIEKQVGDKDVLQEVELRMSELLTERGIDKDKVILAADVTYLKEQLGSPDDFGEDQEESPKPKADKPTRRLFRDTDNALIAGVAAGLGNYFGLDITLVRLIFVLIVIFSAGFGIILYLLLWLIVPPAETASERLQMRGKSVTLESLKDTVSKADIPNATRRINRTVLPVINGMFRLGLKIIGVGMILVSLGIIFAATITKVYMVLHNGQLFQENLFPVGGREQWLVIIALLTIVIAAVFLLLGGLATFRRKWPVRAWITGVLAGLFLIGSAASIVLTADAVPRVRDRYEAGLHTTAITNIQPFNKVQTSGPIDVAYISSPTYAVNLHYFGNLDTSKIKVQVDNGTLTVNSDSLGNDRHCNMLCLYPRYDLVVEIYSPNVESLQVPPNTDVFYPDPALPALRSGSW